MNPTLGWRWCFYINIIAVSLAIILLFFCYHPPTFDLLHERKTKREILKELDYLGMFLWTAGLTVFLMGVSWGGSIYPWKSAATISAIVVGIALLILLFIWEGFFHPKYPAIPIQFFSNRGFMALVVCATVASSKSSSHRCHFLQETTNKTQSVLLLRGPSMASTSQSPIHQRYRVRGLALLHSRSGHCVG